MTNALPLKHDAPTEWPILSMEEACGGVFDCPHSTPVLADDGPFVVRTQDIRGGFFDVRIAGHVSEETYRDRVIRAEPRDGDILFSREGTYFGVAAEVPPNTRVCLGQRMVLLRPNPALLNHRFLRLWLNSPTMQALVDGLKDGSVAERLNMPVIRRLPILLPPLSVQLAITRLLGVLGDKVDLNRRANETLEDLTRAVFKSWFVDFDPVRMKADGRKPLAMDADTARLFPRAFDGDLPRGWREGSIADLVGLVRDGVDPSEVDPTTVYVGLEHLPRGRLTMDEWGVATDVGSGKMRFRSGDVLFGKLRPYFKKVVLAPAAGISSSDIMILRPRSDHFRSAALCFVSSDTFIEAASAMSEGTRMPRASWDGVVRTQIAIADAKVYAAFEDVVEPLLARCRANIAEARSLRELRDFLLPKLMSGAVCVRDAESIVGKVA